MLHIFPYFCWLGFLKIVSEVEATRFVCFRRRKIGILKRKRTKFNYFLDCLSHLFDQKVICGSYPLERFKNDQTNK
uniref:Putative secreted protein n=1 Tax=Ixodes ricinus TaxID=34613 RepID=A0A6B0U562_IXORI